MFSMLLIKDRKRPVVRDRQHTTQAGTIHTYRHVRDVQTQTQCIPHTHTRTDTHTQTDTRADTHTDRHMGRHTHTGRHTDRHRDICTRQPLGRHRLRWKAQKAWSIEFKSGPALNETTPRGKCFISFLNGVLICYWLLGLSYQWARICTASWFCCHDHPSPPWLTVSLQFWAQTNSSLIFFITMIKNKAHSYNLISRPKKSNNHASRFPNLPGKCVSFPCLSHNGIWVWAY